MFEMDETGVLDDLLEEGPDALTDVDLVRVLRLARAITAIADGMVLTAAGELGVRRRQQYRELVGEIRGRAVTPGEVVGHPADEAEVERMAAAEVATAMRTSQQAALDRIVTGQVLAERAPSLLRSLTRGELSWPQARAIHEAAAVLDAGAAQQLVDELVPYARTRTPAQVAARARRVAMRLDARAARARAEAARRTRRARAYGLDDDMGALHITGPAATVAAAWARVDAIARETQNRARRALDHLRSQEPGASVTGVSSGAGANTDDAEVPTLDNLRADTVLQLLAGTHDVTRQPSPHVQVHVDITVPLAALEETHTEAPAAPGRGCEPAEVQGLGPVSAEEARDLLHQARWRIDVPTGTQSPHGRGGDGGCSGHGPGPYAPSAALARAVRARDVTCRFPGCRSRARRCDLDHTVAHPKGPTAACNLACLCRFHHRVKHRGGWHLEQLGDGVLRWTSPTGQTLLTHPPGHSGDRPPPDPAPSCPLPLDGHHVPPPPEAAPPPWEVGCGRPPWEVGSGRPPWEVDDPPPRERAA